MDDIKLYASKKNHILSLLTITENFSNDIGMSFGIDKCKTQSICRGHYENLEYITKEGEIIKNLNKGEFYKYLGINQSNHNDGMTLVPWNKGQPLVWDVTVVDTLADSYVLKTSEVSGFAAEMACKRKHNKYCSIISSNYIFKGLAFETLGPWCKETIDFINVIGDRLIAESGDSKSKKFLFETISLAIQRGNAASIRGTFSDSALLSEIFAL
jgi:hypothetical protein